jgi:hypothetical protein
MSGVVRVGRRRENVLLLKYCEPVINRTRLKAKFRDRFISSEFEDL